MGFHKWNLKKRNEPWFYICQYCNKGDIDLLLKNKLQNEILRKEYEKHNI